MCAITTSRTPIGSPEDGFQDTVDLLVCELVRRQILFQHSSVSAETVGPCVAGQLGFLGLQLLQVFLSELQVLLGLLAFNTQLVNRLFACHIITSFLHLGIIKAPDFLRSRAFSLLKCY